MDAAAIRNDLVGLAQRRETTNFLEAVRRILSKHGQDVALLDSLHILHISVWLTETGDVLWKELLAVGCNPFACDFNGDTSLHYAIRSINIRYIQFLHAKLGDSVLNCVNHQLCNLLITCCAETPDERSFDILMALEWMYLNGMPLEAQDSQGKTALMWAAQRNSLTICHWLLSRGAHLAHRDHMNRTALHVACSNGNYDVALFLCQKGAVNLVHAESHDDKRINTPVKIAWQRGHLWLALSLLSWRSCYALTGHCSFLTSAYAWVAFGLLIWNLVCGEATFWQMSRYGWESLTLGRLWMGFTVLMVLTTGCWVIAAKKDPGSVRPQQQVLPCQTIYCSDSGERDLSLFEKTPTGTVAGGRSATHLPVGIGGLHKLEVASKKIALQIAVLNRQIHGVVRKEVKAKLESMMHALAQIAEDMNLLRPRVALERKNCDPAPYVERVLGGRGPLPNVCLTCHDVKNIRQHHCSECGVCVQRFDHHCVWVDNCIGLKNQRSFLFFLYSMVASLLYYFAVAAIYIRASLTKREPLDNGATDYFTRNLLALLLSPLFYLVLMNCVSNILWLCFSGFLLIRTTRSMITDVTFYELIKRSSYIEHRFGKAAGPNRRRSGACCTADGYGWDFADCTLDRCVMNSLYFLAQSNGRDEVNYKQDMALSPLLAAKDEELPIGYDAPIDWRFSNMPRRGSAPIYPAAFHEI
ncbi:putative DHHC zinc finger protein [Gregarina niphandrodes]|uniref:Palmitoyltransferase n=1 Tax=Gregarina niphandrodes TaxID=110365 RepID=A0A023B014_GRENI|nr:putative DHHC zinc finger protein [Gregarina niphandrodes]EZG44280.1 putative DHHC zinc finger protein [Gregarina niphandrodes]|eukprot:XP_011132731.1 putative DHHC zinc finger protein [Gregarina niphandrodes]